jgi:uncharacterized protein with FMN-binding domain
MAQTAELPQAANKVESPSFFAKAASEVADFGEGLYYGAIESPINGAVQFTNHLAGTKISELHLVDEKRLDSTVGGVLGHVAGTAADVVAATIATSGVADVLGGAGLAGTALRFGALGAAYTTFLQPTDDNSQHFFEDRFANGAIALGTYAAMGGAAAGLDALGTFAVPGARSLAASLAYGGISGLAGGVAHSEATAVLKDNKAIPSLYDFGKDLLTYGAFGMAYSGIGFEANKLMSSPPRLFTTDKNTAQVTSDAQGNPIQASFNVSSTDHSTQIQVVSSKMTDGTWSTTATADSGIPVLQPQVSDVKVDGNTLYVKGADGYDRSFTDGGAYQRIDVVKQARDAALAAEWAKYNKVDTQNGVTVARNYDKDMRIQTMKATPEGATKAESNAFLSYDSSGQPKYVSMSQGAQNFMMSKQPDNSWRVYANDQTYKWNGDVHVLPATAGGAEQIQLTPSGGTSSTFDVKTGISSVKNMMESTSTYLPGATGNSVVAMGDNGTVTLTAGTTYKPFVNGEPIAPGQTVSIKPGDDVKMNVDVGDRYAIWETKDVKWGRTADGTPVFGTTPLKPGTQFDFKADGNSTVPSETDYTKK